MRWLYGKRTEYGALGPKGKKEESQVGGSGSRGSQSLSKNSGRGFQKAGRWGRKGQRRRQNFLGWGLVVRGNGKNLTH